MPIRKDQRSNQTSPHVKHKAPKSSQATDALDRIKDLEREMAQVIREMQEKVRQLECLNDFSSLMNSSLDTDRVSEKALVAACQLLGCETASLLLVDKTKGELYGDLSIRFAIDDQSIAGSVAMTGESLII